MMKVKIGHKQVDNLLARADDKLRNSGSLSHKGSPASWKRSAGKCTIVPTSATLVTAFHLNGTKFNAYRFIRLCRMVGPTGGSCCAQVQASARYKSARDAGMYEISVQNVDVIYLMIHLCSCQVVVTMVVDRCVH